jgi:hypothetical protein
MFQTREATGNRRPRLNKFWSALLWLTVVVLAVYPFPWWW